MKVNKVINTTVKEELEIIGATLLSVEEAKMLTQEERRYSDWWWLCSPGYDSNYAANIYENGYLYDRGYRVTYITGCVRPALKIKNLDFSNFKIGNTFKIGNYEFKVISDNCAWMHKQDIGHCAFNWNDENGNKYESSDVKKFVDKWFEDLLDALEEEPNKKCKTNYSMLCGLSDIFIKALKCNNPYEYDDLIKVWNEEVEHINKLSGGKWHE